MLETLTGIRNKRRGKKMNTFLSQWNFYQLEQLLAYKSEALGIQVGYIDPRYTSQACNQCGVINKKNRVKNRYSCECGWRVDADLNAAYNIRDLFVKPSQSLQVEQAAVNQPIEPLGVTLVDSSYAPRGHSN